MAVATHEKMKLIDSLIKDARSLLIENSYRLILMKLEA